MLQRQNNAHEIVPISFPAWKDVLGRSNFSDAIRESHLAGILSFLRHCKSLHAPVTVALIKTYLAALEAVGGVRAVKARDALRWFYQEARRVRGGEQKPASTGRKSPVTGHRSEGIGRWSEIAVRGPEGAEAEQPPLAALARGVTPSTEIASGAVAGGRRRYGSTPPLAREDLGGPDWERDLIRAVRQRGLLWRTEETYRGWAARFVRFLAPRSPYAADASDVGAFLTVQAVELRSSPATQKQALNALVFLMQEGLGRHLGEIDFRRPAPRRRVPTVLSRDECVRLFEQLEGTTRLMAELMYGSGLRLLELLRLRVHHLDLERGQLRVPAAKGDKDRVTVLPLSLVPQLQAHMKRLRELHANDRAAGLPGVWLPEGLARKYQKAGEKWEWQQGLRPSPALFRN